LTALLGIGFAMTIGPPCWPTQDDHANERTQRKQPEPSEPRRLEEKPNANGRMTHIQQELQSEQKARAEHCAKQTRNQRKNAGATPSLGYGEYQSGNEH